MTMCFQIFHLRDLRAVLLRQAAALRFRGDELAARGEKQPELVVIAKPTQSKIVDGLNLAIVRLLSNVTERSQLASAERRHER